MTGPGLASIGRARTVVAALMSAAALAIVAAQTLVAAPASAPTAVPATGAQAGRPRAEVVAVIDSPAATGEPARVSLHVRLPKDVHVQAHEPRDPLLIPTVLTVTAPVGVTVEAIVYPRPTDLAQIGRAEPLSVLGPEFHIDVRLAIVPPAAGELVVPVALRYQACNDAVCFPPARATAEWRLTAAP